MMNSFTHIPVMTISALSCLLLTGCLAPKLHPWQTPAAELDPASWNWSPLSTNQYCHVVSNQLAFATARLDERAFIALEAGEARTFTGSFQVHTSTEQKPYLIRGVHFGHYSFTEVRFDSVGRRLFVAHATYNGEMLFPFIREAQAPTALVAFLPQPPAAVYTVAYKGGDGIWRVKDFKTLDTRK